MGWLKKRYKAVKKGLKKLKKKFKLKKVLKIAAIIGGALVTGGAAIGAFTGGTATGIGGWMMNASNSILNFKVAGLPLGKVFTPFKMVGTGLGKGARAITDFTGITKPATTSTTAATGSGTSTAGAASSAGASAGASSAGGGFGSTAFGQALGTVAVNTASGVATGYLSSLLEGDPEVRGSMAGLNTEEGVFLDPVSSEYYQANINLADAYKNLTYGTADLGYLSQGLFEQDILRVT
jgi:hypothetical protein